MCETPTHWPPYMVINGLWLLLIISIGWPVSIWCMQKNEVFSYLEWLVYNLMPKLKVLWTNNGTWICGENLLYLFRHSWDYTPNQLC